MGLLTVHLYVAFAVVVLAIVGVWRRSDRRITLYVVTLQILIGIGLLFMQLRAPSVHYALALLGFIGYMVAGAISKRPDRGRVALAVSGISSLLILDAFYIGMHAVRVGG
jgi:uncharacterized protein YqhQ